MRTILPWLAINGTLVQNEAHVLSALDSSVQSGYGVFTTIKVRESIPLFFDKHEQRLVFHMQVLGWNAELPTNIQKTVLAVIAKNDQSECAVRVTITAGTPFTSIPTVIVQATTLRENIRPISVITLSDTRGYYKTIKTINRVPHLLALQQAQQQHAHDAIFCQGVVMIESTIANIFSLQDNTVITPPIRDRGLDGITRQILLQQLLRQERDIPVDTTNPLVLVNSLGIRVVESVNGKYIKQNAEFVEKIRKTIDQAEKKYRDNASL